MLAGRGSGGRIEQRTLELLVLVALARSVGEVGLELALALAHASLQRRAPDTRTQRGSIERATLWCVRCPIGVPLEISGRGLSNERALEKLGVHELVVVVIEEHSQPLRILLLQSTTHSKVPSDIKQHQHICTEHNI